MVRFIPILGFILLAACSSNKSSNNLLLDDSKISLEEGTTIGQTFVANFDGLNGLEFLLESQDESEGKIIVHLREDPGAEDDLASGTFSINQNTKSGFHKINFRSQPNSNREYYYAFLEVHGIERINLGTKPGDDYLDGSLYSNHEPLDLQAVFRTAYDPIVAGFGFIKELFGWIVILTTGIFLYLIPGYSLVTHLWPNSLRLSTPSRLAIGVGVSLALYPLLLLWTDVVNIHLGVLYAWIPGVVGSLALLWRVRYDLRWKIIPNSIKKWRDSDDQLHHLLLVILIAILFLTRFFAVRSIDTPMWGDSLQHTMIAQLLVDNGGLFESWQPYAELQSFTYHFGFHSDVAVFSWITGRSAMRSTLWMGQILNVLAVFTLYPLAKITKHKSAALIALLVAGFFSPFPNFYSNWGRYTQLAGLTILPIVTYLSWVVLEHRSRNLKLHFLTVITMAGLGLTHYRILIFAALFFPAYLLIKGRKKRFRNISSASIYLAFGSLVLFIPWLPKLFSSELINVAQTFLETSASTVPEYMIQYNTLGSLSNYAPLWVWVIASISLGWSLWTQKMNVIVLGVWWVLIVFVANPGIINLPGTGAISNFAVFISAYIPISLGLAFAFSELSRRLSNPWIKNLIILVLVILATNGVSRRIGEISPDSYALVTEPDKRASSWITENLDSDARFFVNSFSAYGNTLVVGSDGGWWLPLLAERESSLPPLTYSWETGPIGNYIQWVNELTFEFQELGIHDASFLSKLEDRNITHIYIGQRQGKVNYFGSNFLSPDQLLNNPVFQPIYHEDRVWIFSIES